MKQTLRNLIAEGKTAKMLINLRKITLTDDNLKNEVSLIAARFSELERQNRLGFTDPSVSVLELNKINYALLDIIDQLKDNDTDGFQLIEDTTDSYPIIQNVSNPKRRGLPNLVYWLSAIMGLVCLIIFYFVKNQDKSENRLTNITVYIEDKNHDLILKQQGQIIMDVTGGEAKKEDIDSKGTASFKNVKIGDKVHLKVDFSEPYRPIQPDSVYTITADGRIILNVGLQNLSRVFGTVFWRDEPLSGVVVAIGDLQTTTDSTGSYVLPIPEAAQRKEQEVKFFKKGYKMLIKKAYPQTNVPMNVVMEKL
jgi:hypothetical protein